MKCTSTCTSIFGLIVLVACSAATPEPAVRAAVVPATSLEEPQAPGYLGLGFVYHQPDPAKGSGGWLLVRHVPEDGPAYRMGLKPQTVITAINGRPLDFPDESGILAILKTIRPGDTVRLTLAGPERKELAIVAADMPPDKLRIWQANFERGPAPRKNE